MGKKVKVQYTKDIVVEVDPVVWDLCDKVNRLLLNQESSGGYDAVDRSLDWYAEVYKGGVGMKEAEAILKKNSLFWLLTVEQGYKYVMELLDKHGPAKRPKKDKAKQTGYDPEFVYAMCAFYVEARLKDKSKPWTKYRKTLMEKYDDKERVTKRLHDRAQSHASVMRTLLEVLEGEGKLPKAAYPKVRK